MRRHLRIRLLYGPSLIALMALVACVPIQSVDTQLILRKGEVWDTRIDFTLSPEGVPYSALVAQTLNESVAEMVQAGVQASWELLQANNQDTPTYRVKAEGQGYQLLNQAVLDQNAVSVIDIDGRRQIEFRYYDGRGMFGAVPQNTFSLRGGQIYSSNGVQINNNTVQWINPTGTMEAVLSESSGSSWIWYLLLLGFIGGGIYAYRSYLRKPPTYAPASNMNLTSAVNTPPSAYRFCANCGSSLPGEASFCPHCGAQKQ